MQNDHEDKYEPHEESEYHFSDEEVTYEAEHEPAKAEAAAASPRESILKQFTQRRLIISGVVFVVLVFAIYKMISPSSTSIPTPEIAATPTMVQNKPLMQTQPVQPATAPAPVMQQAAAPVAPAAQQPAPSQPTVAMQPAPAPAAPLPALQQQAAAPAVQPVQETTTTTTVAANPPAPVAMPNVIPVETTVTTQGTGGLPVVSDQQLNAKNQQLTVQLSASVEQKLNEVSSLNQELQGQVQQLNSRVANMEAQLNQLVQALTQPQGQPSSSNTSAAQQFNTAAAPLREAPQAEPMHVAYNVQAIIPGRAWLKSDNGETLTVAEGDSIHNLGRVVKIDPYDGVVEINTGSRVISLSYGNAG